MHDLVAAFFSDEEVGEIVGFAMESEYVCVCIYIYTMILQTHQGPQEPLQQWLSSPSGAYVALLVDEFAAPENRKDLGTSNQQSSRYQGFFQWWTPKSPKVCHSLYGNQCSWVPNCQKPPYSTNKDWRRCPLVVSGKITRFLSQVDHLQMVNFPWLVANSQPAWPPSASHPPRTWCPRPQQLCTHPPGDRSRLKLRTGTQSPWKKCSSVVNPMPETIPHITKNGTIL